MTRLQSTLVLLLAVLAGCRGAVSARGMKALGPWADREIAVEGARPDEGELVAWGRAGAVEGLKEAGLAIGQDAGPEALVIRVRELRADEGRPSLLASPAGFALDRAPLVVAGAAGFTSHLTTGAARDRALDVKGAALGVELVKQLVKVRLAFELFAPGRERPVGGVAWEGYRNLDGKAAAQDAGREAGRELADEIASQRDRWADRRPSSERLLLTPTPLLLAPGEAVVSLDQGLLLHAGVGVRPWLQLDAAVGGAPVPTAGGILHARYSGATVVGAWSVGLKVRLVEETWAWPGLAASFERVGLFGGALGTGRVELLGHVVDADAPGASSRIGLNLVTLAASKHPVDWLQVGAGAILVDGHPLLGSATPFTDAGGGGAVERFPTQVLPYVNVEARAGEHFRFIGEYLATPGPDAVVLGLRSLLLSGRRVGVVRAPGWKLGLDTAAIVTARETADGRTLALLPWIGLALYPR
ncbi:MAG TPA: hypothetical protein VLT47_02810 [Anaeromyxobacteraceae bacterium]|nr:hypothetical protein [Anaeromyxobacteraceae bacterium]